MLKSYRVVEGVVAHVIIVLGQGPGLGLGPGLDNNRRKVTYSPVPSC